MLWHAHMPGGTRAHMCDPHAHTRAVVLHTGARSSLAATALSWEVPAACVTSSISAVSLATRSHAPSVWVLKAP